MRQGTCLLLSLLIFATPLLAKKNITSNYSVKWNFQVDKLEIYTEDNTYVGYCKITDSGEIEFHVSLRVEGSGSIYEALTNNGDLINEIDLAHENYEKKQRKWLNRGKFKLFKKGEELGIVGKTGDVIFTLGAVSLLLGGTILVTGEQDQYEGDNEESSTWTAATSCFAVGVVATPLGFVLFKLDGGNLDKSILSDIGF